ncbi:hypothetical protein FQA39_LY19065 [Lamprigera yunnana]|nr:hypothetical protein FQA39_LY19065 [Lamprigera yunnana]
MKIMEIIFHLFRHALHMEHSQLERISFYFELHIEQRLLVVLVGRLWSESWDLVVSGILDNGDDEMSTQSSRRHLRGQNKKYRDTEKTNCRTYTKTGETALPDIPISPKKNQDKKCEEKCYQIKSEKSCNCQHDASLKRREDISSGCSRTNPIDWSLVNVKKEPGSNPCQVAEITTSVSPVVKIEVTSPTHKISDVSTMPSVTTNGNIPVGIAVARQRIQHHDLVSSPSLPPTGLLTTVNTTTRMSRLSEIDSTPGMAAGTIGGVPGGGAVLQCTEDRSAGLATWSVSGSHNSTIATPTLWQYPGKHT